MDPRLKTLVCWTGFPCFPSKGKTNTRNPWSNTLHNRYHHSPIMWSSTFLVGSNHYQRKTCEGLIFSSCLLGQGVTYFPRENRWYEDVGGHFVSRLQSIQSCKITRSSFQMWGVGLSQVWFCYNYHLPGHFTVLYPQRICTSSR